MNTKLPTLEAWKALLVNPERQWKQGYSARTMALCWTEHEGFPVEIERVLNDSGLPVFQQIEIVKAKPEYAVRLAGRGNSSCTDLMAWVSNRDGKRSVLSVEGKVEEGFGLRLDKKLKNPSQNMMTRWDFIQKRLELADDPPLSLFYQLFHRLVSALIEAETFKADSAVMIVHSFSRRNSGFREVQNFAGLWGVSPEIDKLSFLKKIGDIDLYCAWVSGDKRFLDI